MSELDYCEFLSNFAELGQPKAKRRALLAFRTPDEIRQIFHRFSFGSLAIKTGSEESLEAMLQMALDELRAVGSRAA